MRESRTDAGFTLVEVLVTIVLMGIVTAFAVGGWRSWAESRGQSETATELRVVLRNAQQRAITEGVSMCVSFTADSYTVWRSTCATGTRVDGPYAVDGPTRLDSPVFAATAPQSPATVVFAPRGTASAGAVSVVRDGSSTVYRVKVVGFTGRPYVCRTTTGGDCNDS